MRKFTQLMFIAVAMLFTSAVFAQSNVSGTILDSELNAPLPGANVLEKGTTNGVSSDFDGKFTLATKASSGEVVVSFVGYGSVTLSFNGDTDLGTITLTPDNSLEEVVIVGTGVIDLVDDRKTPVAVSTIKASEIQDKIGTQDVTMTLANTPSVYVAGQSGGFGDSRINVRGFDQTNTAYLLNGQPINGMEDGKMYWSNWSGISDIASVVQMQRGLGASKLAISSVGGTVNFVTKTTDKDQGGYFSAAIANDNYLKTTYNYNTGKNDKGWGASFMLSHWQGDGYNEGNYGMGQTYFISVGYTPNERHNFNFLITGAPQWHDQNFSKSIDTYLEYGRKYNNNWGMYGNQYLTERRNFYHKPIINLNWDWAINETSSLSTVLYASFGRGGGTGDRGNRQRTADGYIDYNGIYAYNNSVPGGAGGRYAAGGGYVTRSSMNLHNWFGLVTNYSKQFNENLSLNVGFDLRTYHGDHFRVVENFHGLTSWQENIRLLDQNNNHQSYGTYGTYKNVITTRDLSANPWAALFTSFEDDEKIAYNSAETISYGGLFAQLEYEKDDFTAFFQGSISNQSHQRFDYYQYADQSLIDGTSSQGTGTPLPAGIEDGVDSEKISNFGYNLKGGAGYAFNESHKIYGNIGYYSRQPFHDNMFPQFTNQYFPLAENETIFGLELGYSYRSQYFRGNVNLYRTSWKDRVAGSSYVDNDVVFYETNFGVEQLHSGLEIDFVASPFTYLDFKGFLSIGDWEYKGNATTQTRDEDQNIISTELEDVDGGKVGDAAQFSAGLGVVIDFSKSVSFDSDIRYYDNLYANVGAVKDNLELPSYNLVDMGLSYKMLLGEDKDKSLTIRGNVNNVFDYVYLSDLRSAIKPGDSNGSGELWKGIDTNNQGYFGYGRTWNLQLRYRF